ncbi:GNAT family N-acetyltransferase [Limosilactobacillus antri]|uniref:GNAT family N-acetyltransferase n=1 Tax=Limosilactobacillus antri TaxID=227943 RepID=UPI001F576DC8|nr:GNAT family N-acetyltransferase [Limosilactobacillus antri]
MSTIYLRRTYMRDLPAINRIIKDAKDALKAAGSPQWQDGHPNQRTIINDITHHLSWALVVDEEVVGVATLLPGPERSYQDLQGGTWNDDDNPYLTIHRVAINSQYQGQHLSTFLFSNLLTIGQERGYTNFRIDTHRLNKAMQAVAQKFGFQYRGTVQVDDQIDPARLAYELNLPTNSLPVEYHVNNDFMRPMVNRK